MRSILVGAVGKALGNNEVIGFTEARAPAIVENASWTSKTDNIVVKFDAKPYPVPVRVYVVAGDVAKQKKKALAAVLLANGIWKAERMGLVLKLSSGDLVDATTTAGAFGQAWLSFTRSGLPGCNCPWVSSLGMPWVPAMPCPTETDSPTCRA